MSFDLRDGIVRILKPNGETAGIGFVLTLDGLIATCSHVVQSNESQKRGEPKPEKTTIVFRATNESREAQIEPNWWRSSNKGEDVAILRVKGGLPERVISLPLGSSKGTSTHPFDTFGFPKSNLEGGIWGDGHILGETELQHILVRQLSSKQVTPGFSGAPVVDRLRRRVVGMVTSIIRPDEYGRLTEAAFITPVETLRDVCSDLILSDVSPYRGLNVFTESHAEFFFGRERVVDGLVNRLSQGFRFLTVMGASGSGKSSVVQAGLIPRLRQGAVGGSDPWGVIVSRPADDPFKQLIAKGLPVESHHLTRGVADWFDRHQNPKQTGLVLIIDQFEELLTTCPKELCRDFITQLTFLLRAPLLIKVILVMRNDFFAQFVQHESLKDWMEHSGGPLIVSEKLTRTDVATIVQKPAQRVGWRFEDGLVETIVKDVMQASAFSTDEGQYVLSTVLPLLEFALSKLWEGQRDGILTHDVYNANGGVTGGLTQWADQVYYGLGSEEKQRKARRIFTDLVHIGDESQKLPDSRCQKSLVQPRGNSAGW